MWLKGMTEGDRNVKTRKAWRISVSTRNIKMSRSSVICISFRKVSLCVSCHLMFHSHLHCFRFFVSFVMKERVEQNSTLTGRGRVWWRNEGRRQCHYPTLHFTFGGKDFPSLKRHYVCFCFHLSCLYSLCHFICLSSSSQLGGPWYVTSICVSHRKSIHSCNSLRERQAYLWFGCHSLPHEGEWRLSRVQKTWILVNPHHTQNKLHPSCNLLVKIFGSFIFPQ